MHRLREIQLFSKFSDLHIDRIRSQYMTKSYTKEGIVFYEGDDSNHIFVVLEGTVKLYKTSPKGTQIQINRFDAPAVIGEYACFEHAPFPATCEFVTEGKIALIPRSFIISNLGDSEFALEMIKSLTAKIMVLSSLIHKETIFSSEAKVAKIMIENSEIFDKLKHNEIASILNISPETLSRILKKFKNQHLIESVKSGNIVVLDLEALNDVIETNKVQDCTNCIAHFKVEHGLA
ncbi:MAG TPA: Crp/Fnr family transcriptional regulator [Sulfurovum sp.]|nr:Crp/Fnr family transcriptional regulator [Sulfurovum sp.]